jgi:adenine-specific DNA-methyltransferase
MANSTLEHLIKDFSTEGIARFFRERSPKFTPRKESLDEYSDELFKGGVKLGEIKFDETEELIVCAFSSDNSLSERSGKKAQYEKAKKVLKDRVSDAGIFVFYDVDGNFRFSLIYTNYLGKKKDWSTFKRFTYFVSKEFTNKTFLQRIGEADFSSLDTIQEAFSVEKVTKEFYENISYWYFWAVKKCIFPKDAEAEENGRNISVIRLITRIIFVWFMRERKLISKELFDRDSINNLLLDSSNDSSTYYQAILQNLFFATLSTKQEERQFRSEIRGQKGFNSDHGNPYVFRFHEYLKNPDKVHELFVDIPFLNGGLFDCLDDSEKGIYIDGFTEAKKNQAIVPNILFFGKEIKVDLSGDFGDKQKNCTIKGLINLLSEFNFTIDENTSDDKDVALDPELLGRVFENLLASFNPETSSTARKATGSYYTPREIVDFMVDQSLKGYLTTHLSGVVNIDDKLAELFSHETQENPFTLAESKKIVNLIESVRVVDPAVGSGAFPMGMLNKLVYLLHKVDPQNDCWKQAQLNAAEQIPDSRIRQETRDRIEAYFKKNDNYGRKLFLIQKCIYGVDIQQIAVEIAKLRFFISLLVDEDIDKSKENWGIEPLPNLDFKIMQGNSLISEFLGMNFEIIKEPSNGQVGFVFQNEKSRLIQQFESKKIDYQSESDKTIKQKLLQEIDFLIIELFEMSVKQQQESYSNAVEVIKRKYSVLPNIEERDEIIRNEVQKINTRYNFDLNNIEKQLNEYSGKLKTKPFFLWMLYFAEVFNEKEGFDIVIGNPPYIGEKGKEQLFHPIAKTNLGKKYYSRWMDYFYYFFHQGLNIGNTKSIIAFITTNYFLTATGAINLRRDIKQRASIKNLINFNELKIFESAKGQHNLVTILDKNKNDEKIAHNLFTFKKGNCSPETLLSIISENDIETQYYTAKQAELFEGADFQIRLAGQGTSVGISIESVLLKMKSQSLLLGDICQIIMGLVTRADRVSNEHLKKDPQLKAKKGDGIYILTDKELQDLHLSTTDKNKYVRPYFKNSDIGKYYSKNKNSLWLLYIKDNGAPIILSKELESHFTKYKILLTRLKENFLKNEIASVFVKRWLSNGNYFVLFNPKKESYFTEPKIIAPYRSKKNTFSYNEISWFASQDVCFILPKNRDFNLKYILAILNSKLCFKWLWIKGKKKGEMLELMQKPLSGIPIKKISKEEQEKIAVKVDQIINAKRLDQSVDTTKIEKELDQIIYHLYGLTDEEIDFVETRVAYDPKATFDEGETILE